MSPNILVFWSILGASLALHFISQLLSLKSLSSIQTSEIMSCNMLNHKPSLTHSPKLECSLLEDGGDLEGGPALGRR